MTPFREKLKKAFKSSSPSSSKASSPVIEPPQAEARWPSNVYKPGEPMPRAKYRAPVKKEHKEKLESFSFGTAWRRKSATSLHSPMGSRMPSRRGSLATRQSYSSKRPSISGRRSISAASGTTASNTEANRSHFGTHLGDHESDMTGSKDVSRSGSIGGPSGEKRFKDPYGAAKPTRLSTEVEQEGDDDVANVGLSRVNSNNLSTLGPAKADSAQALISERPDSKSGVPGYDHRPFSEHDLTLAMQRSHISVPTES